MLAARAIGERVRWRAFGEFARRTLSGSPIGMVPFGPRLVQWDLRDRSHLIDHKEVDLSNLQAMCWSANVTWFPCVDLAFADSVLDVLAHCTK